MQPPPHGAPPPPPPPPFGGPPADPYAAQRALAEWAQARSYTLNPTPDIGWYRGWQPFTYVTHFMRVGRELRATFEDIGVTLVEVFEEDPLKQAAGEDRHLVGLVTSAKLRYRGAVRSKQGAGDLTDFGRSLGALFGNAPQPGAVLGDPVFEQRFDVSVPSREEGIAALPAALRQYLVSTPFRGALEVRPGGMAVQFYGVRVFDAARLDTLTTFLSQAYGAAVSGQP